MQKHIRLLSWFELDWQWAASHCGNMLKMVYRESIVRDVHSNILSLLPGVPQQWRLNNSLSPAVTVGKQWIRLGVSSQWGWKKYETNVPRPSILSLFLGEASSPLPPCVCSRGIVTFLSIQSFSSQCVASCRWLSLMHSHMRRNSTWHAVTRRG